ncbi:OPT-domain-containing protein [Fomitopsis betulina]|nr:OPT-domain-containing protein [Fomitopsis betulina]
MAGRQPSPAGRPYTPDRPSTARPSTSGAYFDRDPQYTFSQEYAVDDEEDDESDAEDVFAFCPPPTAQQQLEQFPPAQYAEVPFLSPGFADSPGPRSVPVTSTPISIPPPTFDPYNKAAPYSPSFPGPVPGPSTLHSRHPYPMSPVETPPSTESNGDEGDAYRLRRLSQAPASPLAGISQGTGKFSGISSALSSRGAHISLSDTKEKYRESLASKPKLQALPSTPGSIISYGSMMEVDSQEGSVKMDYDFDEHEEEDSPYAEVRASVSNIDDPEMPVLTLRMWTVGLGLIFVAAAANIFFYMRQPAPSITSTLLVILAHPLGKLLAYWLPITTHRLPRWLGGGEWSLNPGPWNIKEHALVYMMSNVATGAPYAIQATISIDINYGRHFGYWFNTVLILATQLTGFGLAGMCKRMLVYPASMIWPQNLIVCTLLNTLHAEEDEPRGGISRFRYLVYVGTAAFVFYFLPGYLFTALSVFTWICWIKPDNVRINQAFGIYSGMGVSFLTFDWTEISWITSPLMVPWWAQVQVFTGFVIFYWIMTPALYYTNTWNLAYFPMYSSLLFDKFGKVYNVSMVLTDGKFNATAFDDYSPLYLPAAYAMAYLMAFTLATCVIVHTVLFHGRAILKGFRRIQVEKEDIHAKLMKAYPEVPFWWYLTVLAVFFCMGVVAVEVWDTDAPVWFILLALVIPAVYLIPSGYLYSITGQVVSINIIAQVIPGTLLPGQPIPNMIFKSLTLQTLTEGTRFVQDMKLGHYVKIPPRATFIVQLTSTFLVAFIQCGMQKWMFDKVPDICTQHQRFQLTCPHNEVFYEASVLWGVIGPNRQFGTSSPYHPELYALLVGAFLPIPFWLWQRRHPSSWVRYVNTPLILNGISPIPPATGINYSSWFLVGFIFQYVLRRKNFAWWSKFNYVTSAALDSGTVISLLVIFFTLEFPNGGHYLSWWGNDVWKNTMDFKGAIVKTPPSGGVTQ